MKVLILNGSPKKHGASKYLSGIVKCMLIGCSITEYSLRNENDYEAILLGFKEADAVFLSAPLYVDGIPSHMIRFLKEAEFFCKEHPCRFKLYAVSNNGFIEGRQSELHLEQYRCWCDRAGIIWGGGVGLGGGVMLHVLAYVALVYIGLLIIQAIMNAAAGTVLINAGMLINFGKNMGMLLFLGSGMLLGLGRLAWFIRRKECAKNFYSRVMLPSFLFLVVADIFMALSALLNGKLIFSLYRKDSGKGE